MSIEKGSRKEKILLAVIQDFILTGKPVGSGAIACVRGLNVSTATIRNELAALEDMGFLGHPHTSAGRVPTDIAYRYYVDVLMRESRPSGRDAEAIERLFTAQTMEMESLFQEASVLLSRLTHSTAIVFAPFSAANPLRHLDLVRLSSRRVMLIVITSKGQVGRQFLRLAAPVTTDTVNRVETFLNKSLAGRALDQINSDSLLKSARFAAAGAILLKDALEAIRDYLGAIEERVFIGGAANLISERGSARQEWAQVLMEAMEKQYFILDLLKDLLGERQLTVRIGEENRLRELQRYSLVGASYEIGQGMLGSLGVVGPTSMDYARTICMVQSMAKNLGRTLNTSEK
ncbi:MAG: heat-inducible transcription repressor HrcA [Candidatus Anoxymicrobium japonicum]|uniref:Heat-inducible transcription repressor HrcA n=1 Tax=Candidatus Anoxymicrobium japonicum TaxID=2013648 RepID=A0A2N3G7K2_9ACTN|nr:MAG: heat-inducible transcription repressor HrcA [Candidatus Anoxymicrobium japonicum]